MSKSQILEKQKIKDLYQCPDCKKDTHLELYQGKLVQWVKEVRVKAGFLNPELTKLIQCECGRIFSSIAGAKK